jgi:beta-glucosidase
VLAMIEILKRRPDAIFIQSESSEYFHADSPAAIGPPRC